MAAFTHPLESVKVASPCDADWGSMTGDDRRRFCGQCERHVYNLSAMTRAEAGAFVAASEGRTCIRFYRRHDGTILTSDCPDGAPRESSASKASVRFAALFGLAAGAAALVKLGTPAAPSCPAAIVEPLAPMPPPPGFMGQMAAPPAPAARPLPELKMGKMVAPPKSAPPPRAVMGDFAPERE